MPQRKRSDPQIGVRAFLELQHLADRHGIGLDSLCKNHGIGTANVYSWMHGTAPGAGYLQRLDALGLDVHYILSGRRK